LAKFAESRFSETKRKKTLCVVAISQIHSPLSGRKLRPVPIGRAAGTFSSRILFFVYKLRPAFDPAFDDESLAWMDPASPLIYDRHTASSKLDERLYGQKLEGRRVVVLAPEFVGPRDHNPVNRLAEKLRNEGARVSIVPDEGPEHELVDEVKSVTQTFGAFRRKMAHTGTKPEPLIEGVLFRAQNHTVFGGPGQGKTMFACYISSELIKRGETVVYLDRENGEGRIHERMFALGCTGEQLEERFYYFEDPAGTLDDAPDYREMLADVKPSLVVFDSLFGFLSAANLDENYGRDVAAWFDAYASPTLEVATMILDHPPKSGDTARGSSRKLDAVDVSWGLSGNFSTDRIGPLKLSLKKSRDGGLGELVSFAFGGTPLRAERGEMRSRKPHERTLDMLEEGMTAGEWLDKSGVSEATFFRHRDRLVKDGLVEKIGDRYSHVRVDES
jgi:hypothetical protein